MTVICMIKSTFRYPEVTHRKQRRALKKNVSDNQSTWQENYLIRVETSLPETWSNTFGGSADDWGRCVRQTSDGGYITVGTTGSQGAGDQDVWLIKTDSLGFFEWERTFGGSDRDRSRRVEETNDGGYIILGTTQSRGSGGKDIWLIKTDSEGNEVWDRTFGGSDDDVGFSVQEIDDGGYVIIGSTHSYGAGDNDVWLIKTNSQGDLEWDRTFGGPKNDAGRSFYVDGDGDGYIIASCTHSYGSGGGDLWLIKTDSKGHTEWDRIFGGAGAEFGRLVRETSDDGYIVAGRTNSYGAGGQDIWPIKTDSQGNLEWERTFGGSDDDEGWAVLEVDGSGYIVSGTTKSRGAGKDDVWLIKVDSNGEKEWDRTLGGSDDDWGLCIQETNDDGYIITGRTNSRGAGVGDLWLIKTDSEGRVS